MQSLRLKQIPWLILGHSSWYPIVVCLTVAVPVGLPFGTHTNKANSSSLVKPFRDVKTETNSPYTPPPPASTSFVQIILSAFPHRVWGLDRSCLSVTF